MCTCTYLKILHELTSGKITGFSCRGGKIKKCNSVPQLGGSGGMLSQENFESMASKTSSGGFRDHVQEKNSYRLQWVLVRGRGGGGNPEVPCLVIQCHVVCCIVNVCIRTLGFVGVLKACDHHR